MGLSSYRPSSTRGGGCGGGEPSTVAGAMMLPLPCAPEQGAFRDWANLPELPLAEVLRGLAPCLRSLFAFAATCRPWRRLLRASAADLVLPRLPPLLLLGTSSRLVPFSPLVVTRPQPLSCRVPIPADAALLSFSRGYLILLRRGLPSGCLSLVDPITGAERLTLPLPSPHFAYPYAALAPSRLLLFHSRHAFFSLPLTESTNPNARLVWTKHSLPRAASFVTAFLEFRGRFFGLTDRAQLMEFHLGADQPTLTAQILPTAGAPDATMFDRSHFGPRLAIAGDRLLLVLFMLQSPLGSLLQAMVEVKKVAVYVFDMALMRWEEVNDIGTYSLFLDCARSAVACVDVGSFGGTANRVYVAAPGCHTWRAFPPGWEAPLGDAVDGPFSSTAMHTLPWPSQIWVYPPLFF